MPLKNIGKDEEIKSMLRLNLQLFGGRGGASKGIIRPSSKFNSNVELYIGGGYDIQDALSKQDYNYVISNLKTTNIPIYRIEEDFYGTIEGLSKGDEFEFNVDLKSFTKDLDFVKGSLNESLRGRFSGGYFDIEEPVVFKTSGAVKTFNAEPYTSGYQETFGVNQKEAWSGGRFKIKSIQNTKMAGRGVKLVEIEQVQAPKKKR